VLALSRNRWVALVHAVAAAGGSAIAITTIRHHSEIVNATGGKGAGTVVLALVAAAAICVAATGVTWLARGDQRWRMPPRPARIALIASVLVVVIAVPAAGHSTIAHGWHEFRHQSGGGTAQSTDPASRLSNLNGNRYFLWRSAVKAFEHAPIKGLGAGTFEFWWSRNGGAEFVRNAHSIYLEPLAEEGLPGGVLTIVMLAGLAVLALRGRLRLPEGDVGPHVALSVVFLLFLFHAGVDWMWQSTAVTVLALSAAAVAAAATSSPVAGRLPVPFRVGAVVLAVVAGLIQLPGLVSTSSIRDSQSRFGRGDVAGAINKANDAIQSEPWAASPYVQRALIEESTDQLDAARLDLIRAARREPTNFRHRLLLARIDAERGDVGEAIIAYNQAKKLRPKSLLLGQP
jgi:O-Antigen ligase